MKRPPSNTVSQSVVRPKEVQASASTLLSATLETRLRLVSLGQHATLTIWAARQKLKAGAFALRAMHSHAAALHVGRILEALVLRTIAGCVFNDARKTYVSNLRL
eukprot:TRINITY_DN19068_c0_g1_i1.p2 TRINITY_DN19068_c0_g1~~TRINITY_DN19068_c0_g1_i1.p2  ORF type:complete len:105 (-),score=20.74 TRINITY_DN19068_c0_g1_i1:11-325(-)